MATAYLRDSRDSLRRTHLSIDSLGQFIGPETWVTLLADFSQLYVETSDLTEKDVVNVRPGQKVTVIPDAMPDGKLTGTVSKLPFMPLKKGRFVLLSKPSALCCNVSHAPIIVTALNTAPCVRRRLSRN